MAAVSLWPYSEESFFYFEVQEKSADFSEPLFHKKGRSEKMHFSARALLVKMCLERPAGRDKHESIK